MTEHFITFTDISVSLPLNIKYIKDLKVKEKVNEHAEAEVICMMDELEEMHAISQITIKSLVKIEFTMQGKKELLFAGYPVEINIKSMGEVCELHVKLVDASVYLDFRKRTRSFQNKTTPYSEIIQHILEQEYHGGCFFNQNKREQNRVFLQYEETDWKFIKRVASWFYIPIFVRAKNSKPEIVLGVPAGKQQKESKHTDTRSNDISAFLQENAETLHKSDSISYEFVSGVSYDLGDKIQYDHAELVIYKKEAYIKNSVFLFRYQIKSEKAIRQRRIIHKELQGKTFEGRVIARKQDMLKIHLRMDEMQSISEASWFPVITAYPAENSGGLYGIPEIGEMISLYLPDTNENNALIKNAISMDRNRNPKRKDPDRRSFGTKDNSEMVFSSKEVKISACEEAASVCMKSNDGIQMNACSKIKISGKNVVLAGKRVLLKSGSQLLSATGSSNILVDKIMHIRGDDGVDFR